MAGFKPGSSGIRSDHSANCAKNTAHCLFRNNVTKNIEAVYFFLKDYNEIIELLILLKEKYKNTSLAFFIENNIALFQLLFSYDYFDIFHKGFSRYLSDKRITNELNSEKKYFSELKDIIIK